MDFRGVGGMLGRRFKLGDPALLVAVFGVGAPERVVGDERLGVKFGGLFERSGEVIGGLLAPVE